MGLYSRMMRPGASNDLHASGAPEDYRKPSSLHPRRSTLTRSLSHALCRRTTTSIVFYTWQAFAITTEGDKQLTVGKDV